MSLILDLKFVSKWEICPENSDIFHLLQHTDQCNNDSTLKSLVDTVLTRYVEEHDEDSRTYIRNVAIEFFVKIHTRKNLRKYMYEKLNSIKIDNKKLFEDIIDSVTNEIHTNINNLNIFRISQCHHILCFLSAFIQNFSNNSKYVYFIDKVFPFYLCIMEVYISQLYNRNFFKDGHRGKGILEYQDCYIVLCTTLNQLSIALSRAQYGELRSYSVKMVILTQEILQHCSQLKFETISKCTIVLAYFLAFLPKEETVFLKHKDYPILDFLDNSENNYTMVLKSKRISNLFTSDIMKIVLNLGIYTSINQNKMLEIQIRQKSLLEIVYGNLIDLGIQMTSFPDQISPISKTLDAMSKHLTCLPNFDEIFDRALKFTWCHLDHFVEAVVINTRSFLKTIIKDAVHRFQKGEKQHLERFFSDLNSMSVFSKVRLNALVSVGKVIHCDLILENCPHVQDQLLTLATTSADHNIASQVYIQMMTTHLHYLPEEDTIRLWVRPVLSVLRQANIKFHGVLEEIITCAFKAKPTIFRLLFSLSTDGIKSECVIILKCVHYARMQGISLPIEEDADPNEYWRNLVVTRQLELYMIHQDEEVRINVLRVIAECQKSTEEFTKWELNYLIRYFENNISTQTLAIRSKMINYYKKILMRHQVTKSNMEKKITNFIKYEQQLKIRKNKVIDDDTVMELETCRSLLHEYDIFFKHILQLLVSYLNPDANFSRRSICLELLIFIHPFCDPDNWKNLFQCDEVVILKHLLHDSYESNEAMAVTLLRTLSPTALDLDTRRKTREYFETCINLACDIRPSRSVSASYMFQVILQSDYILDSDEIIKETSKKLCSMMMAVAEKIERMFEEGKEGVIEASNSTPFYGLLFICRNLLRNRDMREDNEIYVTIFDRLGKLCFKLKTHVMTVVCNTSPEGYIPEADDGDFNFSVSDQSSKAQKILVYSWKTMKEIMLLLAELANQTVALEKTTEMLPEDFLLKIGDFFVDVFVTTKHRGVFEQAHVAFTTICRSFVRSNNGSLNKLPLKWLDEAVALCTGEKIDERLCATRRSAGLPFFILSMIPHLTDLNPIHLRNTMNPLLTTSRISTDELRMHCLNVLRFLFRNSKLGDHITSFIERGTIAALSGYNSKTWGVRNSATLLLSTLIQRIFGVPKGNEGENCEENRMTLAVFHVRYKNLFDFLLEILGKESGKSDSLVLHPALLILSRLYPSHNDSVNEQVKKHLPFVNICMRNPSYRTRDLAARASISLISEYSLLNQLNKNFERIGGGGIGDTECHGLLLQIRHIFQTTVLEELPISDYLAKSMQLVCEAGRRHSHLTITLYMDIIFMLLLKYRNYENLDLLKRLVMLLSRRIKEEEEETKKISTCQTSYTWSQRQLLLFILQNKFQHVPSTYTITIQILIKALYSKDTEMKKKCLYFLIYLNQQFSDDPYKEHPLITAGDIEISPQIRTIVHSFDFETKKGILACSHPHLIAFFVNELDHQQKKDDYVVLVFLLLRFYPCFFNTFRGGRKQHILDWLLSLTRIYNEEIISAIISCLKTFITSLEYKEVGLLKHSDWIKLMMESAAPSAADYRRLGVAQFMVAIHNLYKCKIFTEYDKYNLCNLIMVLLEDDEAIVRNTISVFPVTGDTIVTIHGVWSVIPAEARYSLLKWCASEFSYEMATCFLVSWALRRLPEVTRDISEVYERGELNIFSENIPITHCASKVLHRLLWNLDILNYENSSILAEQTRLVTTAVLNALIKIPSPMIDIETKRTVIYVFKSIFEFIEKYTIDNDFSDNFRIFFNERILSFLRKNLVTDYRSTKAFLTYLYNPILNIHYEFPGR